jgi:CRP-like cAMP-binding protein
MPYKLKGGIYAVKCRHVGCSFNTRFEIDQNIMGMTEQDVELEARRLARDMAQTKHDAIFGNKHGLKNPEVRKVSGVHQLVGAHQELLLDGVKDVIHQEYKKGEVILIKGESASTICQVIRGFAYPLRNKEHRYNSGDCFGVAALLQRQSRTADIIAGKDGTRIAFFNVLDLSRKNPKKARFLYDQAMEDVFKVIRNLEDTVDRLEQKLERQLEKVS